MVYLSGVNNIVWINGTASDATTGIMTFMCNNSDFILEKAPTAGDPTYAYRNQTPVEGLVEVLINVTDYTSNTVEATLYFNVTSISAPTVTISAPPSNGLIFNVATMWINGTVDSGAVGHNISSIIIDHSAFTLVDDPTGLESGTFSFWNTSVLAEGAHSVNVTVVSTSSYSNYAIRTFSLDTSPPDLAEIVSPLIGANVSGSVTVDANATDVVRAARFGHCLATRVSGRSIRPAGIPQRSRMVTIP